MTNVMQTLAKYNANELNIFHLQPILGNVSFLLFWAGLLQCIPSGVLQ